MNRLTVVFLLASLASCSASRYVINEQERTDYANERNWAALPALKDKADLCPAGLPSVKDAPVDVFLSILRLSTIKMTINSGMHPWPSTRSINTPTASP